jgi:hypothetical protein
MDTVMVLVIVAVVLVVVAALVLFQRRTEVDTQKPAGLSSDGASDQAKAKGSNAAASRLIKTVKKL